MEAIGISFAAALGTCAFFGGIALLMWIDKRSKQHENDLRHTERIKALELGQPSPDVEAARMRAAQLRTVMQGLVGFLIPPILAGIAVGATALVLIEANPSIHLPVLAVIWGVVGVVSLVAVSNSLQALSGKKIEDDEEKDRDVMPKTSERIKEPTMQL